MLPSLKDSIFLSALICLNSTQAKPTELITNESRIINGSEVPLGKYPYAVSLQYFEGHVCSGVVLNKNFVLTSAYCIQNMEFRNWKVLAGSNDLMRGTKYQVVDMVRHEAFDPDLALHALALMKVDPPFRLNPLTLRAAHLALENQPDPPQGAPTATFGWGITKPSGETFIPNVLQETRLEIYSPEECNQILGSPVPDTTMCAGRRDSGAGPCSGDTGAALISDDLKIIGILAWSDLPCGQINSPAVYTRISDYVQWIESTMQKMSS